MSDVDGTLLGDDEAWRELLAELARHPEVVLVPNSSRPLRSLARTWNELSVGSAFPHQVGGLGTEVAIAHADTGWSSRFAGFGREPVDRLMAKLGHPANGEEFQTPLKASYTVPAQSWPAVRKAVQAIVPAQVRTSGDRDFDVIPQGAGKEAPLRFLAEELSVDYSHIVTAGDAMNDLELVGAASQAIVVGNADSDLVAATAGHAYHSKARYAAGVRDGLYTLGILS